jgi:hypothetical protein
VGRVSTGGVRFFKAGNDTAFDAEDPKEFVPESLLLGAFAFRALPFAGELYGVVTDFVPTDWHGGSFASESTTGNLKTKRRELVAPCPEARPSAHTEGKRQAAPVWASSVGLLCGLENWSFSGQPVAVAMQNCFG